jgi:hypothetical protein
MTENNGFDLKSGAKEVGNKVQKVAFQTWLFLQVIGLVQSPMYFLQTAMLVIIAMASMGLILGFDTALLLIGASVVVIIVLGLILHKLGFWRALRNWQYGGQDNDTWFRRSKLACAMTAYFINYSSKEELEKMIDEQINRLFNKWSGEK